MREIIFFKNHIEYKAGRLVLDLFLLLEKRYTLNMAFNKNRLYKTIDLKIRTILIFLEKCFRIVSPPHFAYDFSRKMFLMLYSIN